MDLRKFIKANEEAGTLDMITKGYSHSQFNENMNEIASLVKEIVQKQSTEDDKQLILDQLQSGGISSKAVGEKFLQPRKLSFCTEFNNIIANLQSILGFEFAKYLYVLFGISHYVDAISNNIINSECYEDILTSIVKIRNLLSLGLFRPTTSDSQSKSKLKTKKQTTAKKSVTIQSRPDCSLSSIAETFTLLDTFKPLPPNAKVSVYFQDIYSLKSNSELTPIVQILENIVNAINDCIKSENVIMFEQDKKFCHETVKNMCDNISYNTYSIVDVNDLLLNLGEYSIGYEGSFIKMFEILYKESFADIPDDIPRNVFRPVQYFLEQELKIENKYDKYIDTLTSYFRSVYQQVFKSSSEVVQKMLAVDVSDEVYDMLANICVNLYVNMAKKLSNSQLLFAAFGKSTRIQFMQILQAVMDCTPRLYKFNESQLAVLHFILMNDKTFQSSVEAWKSE